MTGPGNRTAAGLRCRARQALERRDDDRRPPEAARALDAVHAGEAAEAMG